MRRLLGTSRRATIPLLLWNRFSDRLQTRSVKKRRRPDDMQQAKDNRSCAVRERTRQGTWFPHPARSLSIRMTTQQRRAADRKTAPTRQRLKTWRDEVSNGDQSLSAG